jgi:hypothetical protein
MRTTCFLVLSTFGALFLASGCDNKIEQCNAFIDQANAAQSAFVALEAAALNPETLKGRVKQIDESIEKLKGVELKDEKLKGFRDDYVSGLEVYSKGLTKMSSLEKDNVDDFNKLVDELNAAADKESKLVDDVNGYCGGTE